MCAAIFLLLLVPVDLFLWTVNKGAGAGLAFFLILVVALALMMARDGARAQLRFKQDRGNPVTRDVLDSKVVLLDGERAITSGQVRIDQKHGTLLLTNRRLRFTPNRKGPPMEWQLSRLLTVTRFSNKPGVRISAVGQGTADIFSESGSNWSQQIQQALSAPAIALQREAIAPQILLEMSRAKAAVDGSLTPVSRPEPICDEQLQVQCRFCRTLKVVPAAHSKFKCDHCQKLQAVWYFYPKPES